LDVENSPTNKIEKIRTENTQKPAGEKSVIEKTPARRQRICDQKMQVVKHAMKNHQRKNYSAQEIK
jgi:hypothetical protein